MDHRLTLFLVPNCGGDISGYKSGLNRSRDTPVTLSTSITRSAGTLPRAIHPEMLPCDLSPSSRARAVCPPASSQAAINASLLMREFNTRNVNSVNALSGNEQRHHQRMGRKAETEASEFWVRLEESWRAQKLPTSQYGVAAELGMKGNGSTGRWYSGVALPEMSTLREIALRGNVTVDWLLTGRYPKHPIGPDTVLGTIHAAWDKLDSRDHAHVADTVAGRLAIVNLREMDNQKPERKSRTRK